nr:MAG TPA: hypothetical protein [Caudoviricetes sp.]
MVLIAFSSTGRFTLLGEAQGKLCREYGEQDILKYLLHLSCKWRIVLIVS